MRRYWLKSTAVVLIDLVVVGFIGLNLLILRQMGLDNVFALMALSMNLILASILIVANVYTWSLMVTLDTSLRALLKNGVKLTLAHPFWGLLTAVLASFPLIISTFLPRFFFLTVSFATIALIINWGAWRVVRRYLDQDEIDKS